MAIILYTRSDIITAAQARPLFNTFLIMLNEKGSKPTFECFVHADSALEKTLNRLMTAFEDRLTNDI